MNPIIYALNRIIKYDIPKAILNEAFMSRSANLDFTVKTLDQKIREEVINDRIYDDCNILHPTQINVALRHCQYLRGDNFQSVWFVPKTETQGKSIVSAIELTSVYTATNSVDFSNSVGGGGGMMNSAYVNAGRTGNVVGAQTQMQRSASPIPLVSNTSLTLINENTILIKDAVLVPATMILKVAVENDENFNHITRPWYPLFHELCLLAIKQYIYNNLTINIGTGFLLGGMELDKFKEIVDSYSDAGELYSEKLKEWGKSAPLMDGEMKREHYAMVTGGGW